LHHQLDDVIFRYIWRVRETLMDCHVASWIAAGARRRGWTGSLRFFGQEFHVLGEVEARNYFQRYSKTAILAQAQPTANKDSPDIRSNGFLNGICLGGKGGRNGSRWIKCRSATRTA
jgi:hypothetical protein